MFKNKTKQNRNDEKHCQIGIAVKILSNHDGVRATAIVLRSIAASSSLRSPVIAVIYASLRTDVDRPSSELKKRGETLG